MNFARGVLVVLSCTIIAMLTLIVASLFGFTIGGSPTKLAQNPNYTVQCVDAEDNPIAQIGISSSDNGQSVVLTHDGQQISLPFVGNTLFFEEIYARGDAELILEMETHVKNVFGNISGICSKLIA